MEVSLVDYLLMFFSTYFLVFLLGIQSKNVMHSRYMAAMLTSLGISTGNFLFAKYASTGGALEFAVCALGGCLGIASAIYFFDRLNRKRREALDWPQINPEPTPSTRTFQAMGAALRRSR